MTRYRVFGVLVAFMILTVSMSGFAQVQGKNLVGWWLFDDDKEETGNWGDIVFEGAMTDNGQLVLDDNKWAHAKYEFTGYRNDTNLGTQKSNHQGHNMDLRTWKKMRLKQYGERGIPLVLTIKELGIFSLHILRKREFTMLP